MLEASSIALISRILRDQPKFDARLRFVFPIFASKTWIAPADGLAVIRLTGGGGGGAIRWTNTSIGVTGGYSAAWGCKAVRVKKGDAIIFVLGAGGAGISLSAASTNAIAGNPGGLSSITIAGVTYTVPGGPGGVIASAANLAPVAPAGPVLPAGWDFGAASVRPGAVASTAPGNGVAGGAGLDILMQGGDATTSDSVNSSGGGGTGGPSHGSVGGGATQDGRSASGAPAPATGDGIILDVSRGEWGISLYGGSGTGFGKGGNGGGGSGSGSGSRDGGNGGGGGSAVGDFGISGATATAGSGGMGGGGGGGALFGGTAMGSNALKSGSGGNAHGAVELFADKPV